MTSCSSIRLGTRASALARWQAEWVAARLNELEVPVELVPVTTQGDRHRGPIGPSSSPGLFTKELQRALLEERIDLAVHSLKDLPTDPVKGLGLAAVPERAPVADALISRQGGPLDALPPGARIGTGSLRRQAQLRHQRPDLVMAPIRGNLDTRLRKLDEGRYDAIVLAEAGLRRLGWTDRITDTLPLAVMLPAVGQGALGIEARVTDRQAAELFQRLDHPPTRAAVTAERTMLARLAGGCLAPIAAWGRLDGGRLVLTGRVLSPDGREKKEVTLAGDPEDPAALGGRVAEALIGQGAAELLAQAREHYG